MYRRPPLLLLLLLSITLCVACDGLTTVVREGEWRLLGLAGDSVHVLREFDQRLYAGTNNGIYRKMLSLADTGWTPVGLRGRHVNDLSVLDRRTILAAVDISGTGADTTSLYRTSDAGATWQPAQNGFGGGEASNEVLGLARLDDGLLLASGTGLVVAKLSDAESTWEKVWGDWWLGAFSTFVHGDRRWPGLVWAGGEGGYGGPILVKSTDAGDTWTEIRLNVGGDNAHYSIAVDPTDSARVFTGMEGRVLRTQDGGRTWETVLSPPTYPYFFGLAISAADPQRVYAAGVINTRDPQDLVLRVSRDGGRYWSTVVADDVRHGGVRDLLLIRHADLETLYFATKQGVYAYGVNQED